LLSEAIVPKAAIITIMTPPRPDDEEDATPYGMAYEAPFSPPPFPVQPEADDDDFVTPANAPKKKKKRSKADEPEELGKVTARKPKIDILERPDLEPKYPWWVEPAIAGGIGALFILIGIVVKAIQVDKAGAAVGMFLIVGALAVIVVQTALVTALLTVVGHLFSIDYGPVAQAIPKLVSVVTFVNGLTIFIVVTCSPCGLMVAAIAGAAVFQRLFKLTLQEMLLSVAGMIFASWTLNAVVVSLIAAKMAKG
jgi:hypothetical protein